MAEVREWIPNLEICMQVGVDEIRASKDEPSIIYMMTKVEDFICRYWNILYDILYTFFHNEISWNILYDLVLTMEYFI